MLVELLLRLEQLPLLPPLLRMEDFLLVDLLLRLEEFSLVQLPLLLRLELVLLADCWMKDMSIRPMS